MSGRPSKATSTRAKANSGGLHVRSIRRSANRSSLHAGLLGCRSLRPSMRGVDAVRKRSLRALEPTKEERHEESLGEDESRQRQGKFEVALIDFEQNRGAEGPCLPADVPAQDQRRSHLREGTPIPHEDRRRELCDGGNGQTGNQGRREKRLPQEDGDRREEESEVPERTLPTEEKVEEDTGDDRWKGVQRVDDRPDRASSGKSLED